LQVARDQGRYALAHAVDEIRAHRVARVDEQVDDEHLLRARRQRMHEQLDVARAAAPRDHVRVQAVGKIDDVLLPTRKRLLRLLHIGQIHDLDLADQDRVRRFCLEPAAASNQLAGRAERRHDGRLLDDHRNDVLPVVDDEVHAEPERHAHDADDVLDHLVGGIEIEGVLPRRERAKIRRIDETAIVDRANAFLDGELVELGNAPKVAAHRCHPAPPCAT
jgi:hypothetical protein